MWPGVTESDSFFYFNFQHLIKIVVEIKDVRIIFFVWIRRQSVIRRPTGLSLLKSLSEWLFQYLSFL